MSKHAQRHEAARMIRAASAGQPIHGDAVPVEWIEAAAGEQKPDAPKRFSTLAYTGGPMVVANYQAPVVIDLAGLEASASVPMLMGHDHAAIVGHTDSVDVQATQVKAAGAISGIGPGALEVLATAKNGFPWKTSVGVSPQKVEFVREGDTAKVNGRSVRGPAYIARKSSLQEISFVAVAADSKTSATVAATAAITRKGISMEFNAWVEAMGLVVSELRDDQVAKLREKYDGEIKAAAKKDGTTIEAAAAKVTAPTFDLSGVVLAYEKHVATVQAKAAAYVGKIHDSAKLAEIQATAGTKAAELKAQALNEEWAVPRLEVALVKAQADAEISLIHAERPKGPGIRSSSQDVKPQVIEASLCLAGGLRSVEKHYKPDVLEAAAGSEMRHRGLQELILACAEQAGYSGRQRIGASNFGEVMRHVRAAHDHQIEASAFSTMSLPGILSNVANKFLMDGFDAVESIWRQISAIRSVNDFKTITSYRLIDDFTYKTLPPAMDIEHGTVSEESFTNKAATHGRMFTLTRESIINDDLGAFDDLRRRLGRGAALKLNEVFWTAFLDNTSFFSAAHANLATGSALAESTLGAAVLKFRDMVDPGGHPLAITPAMLLVPNALEATAKKLFTSTELRDTTASTKFVTANIYAGSYNPVVSAYLSNSAMGGAYSATTWYLLASAADMPTMEVCFLDGNQSPTIEAADADFSTLGIQFRGYHDFGAAKREYRGGVKSTA